MAPVSTPALETVSGLPVAPRRPWSGGDWLDWARRVLDGRKQPDDYLPVTPEVADLLDRDLASLRAEFGADPAPETVRRQRVHYLLSFHFGGQNVAYVDDEHGVIVLAVGIDRLAEFVRELPYDLCRDVAYTAPEVWM